MKVSFTEAAYLQLLDAFEGRLCEKHRFLLRFFCVFYMHFYEGSETCIFHCKNWCFLKILASRGPIFNAIPDKYEVLSTWKNNDKTGVFWHAKIIVKTDCFGARGPGGLHFLVKYVVFDSFFGVGVTTPQRNDRSGPNWLKSIVFLKVSLMDHAFLHAMMMLAGSQVIALCISRVVGETESFIQHGVTTLNVKANPVAVSVLLLQSLLWKALQKLLFCEHDCHPSLSECNI